MRSRQDGQGEGWKGSESKTQMQKPPAPENPGKLLKNYNLDHAGPVLKMTRKMTKKCNFSVTLFSHFSGHFQDRPGVVQIVIFE